MKITARTIAQALYESLVAAPADQWDAIVEQYIGYTVRMGKSQWLGSIVEHVSAIDMNARGITPVTVTVGHEQSKEAITDIVQRLVGQGELAIDVQVDADSIGGMKVETPNQRWDFTMKRQLQKLAESIINE